MFNRQLNTSWVVNSILAPGKRAGDLLPYQVGLFDLETNLSVNAATYSPYRKYVFKYKSPSGGFETPFGGDERNVNLPLSSLPLGKIDRAHKFVTATDKPKPFIGYLGWDSVSACKSLNLECGKTYGLVIRADGVEVRTVFGRNFEEYVSFTTDCCDTCSIAESAKSVVNKIVKAIEKESFYLNGSFFKAEAVYDCCPAEAPFEKILFKDYCLTVCDTGDSHALSAVQNQYPTLKVERTGYVGVKSTYTVCVAGEITTPDNPATPDTDETVWSFTAPADFTTTGQTRVVCETCPTGYTAMEAGMQYVMELAYNGNNTDYLAVVQALYPTALSATLISRSADTGRFLVVMPSDFNGTQANNTSISLLGYTQASCVEDSPQVVSWVECGNSYKIKRTMCLTLKNTDCDGADRLAELVAAYANVTDIVPGSVAVRTAGECNTEYVLEQYNNACLTDGCDTYGKDGAKFDKVTSFEGFTWKECDCEGWTFDVDGCPVPPADETLRDCRAGVKFTGLFIDPVTGTCRFSPFDNPLVDPVRLEVSFIDPDSGNYCDSMVIPWTILQEPTIPQGLAVHVLRDIIHSRGYDNYIYCDPDAPEGTLWANALGYDFGVQQGILYHHFDVYHYSDEVREAVKTDHKTREVVRFYVPANNVGFQNELVTFLNTTLLNQNTGVTL